MSKAEIRKYLASIGAQGGKKSRRKLSKKDARQMALKRHAKSKAEAADATATVRARARGQQEHNRAGI